jgi:hypothetical protein
MRMAGHVHSYERSTPVYNYTVDLCGSVHITIGDGGNSEGLSGLAPDDKQHGAIRSHLHRTQGCCAGELVFEKYVSMRSEYEDLLGCPVIDPQKPRPSFLYPINPSQDPWSWFQLTLTYQVGHPADPVTSCIGVHAG